MATWYAIYRESDGVLVSVGTVLAAPDVLTQNGYVAVEIPGPPGPYSAWNVTTHSFDTMPTPKDTLSKQDFVERFTEQEWEDFIAYPSSNLGTAAQRRRVNAALKRLEWMEEVDLNLAKTQNAINGLETLGILGAGRAAQIIG
jgi:hypothetical protein